MCHEHSTCASCGEKRIYGILWRCHQCPDLDLCSVCYAEDEHDTRHQFLRIDFPGTEGYLELEFPPPPPSLSSSNRASLTSVIVTVTVMVFLCRHYRLIFVTILFFFLFTSYPQLTVRLLITFIFCLLIIFFFNPGCLLFVDCPSKMLV